ncbi:hypothetical protein OIV83_000048 [Microbotryomycetes sp. JL201]|nr:hypothetical protein OIV83_000048 [Microbotryomycetes sp. JL201]
MSDSDDDRRQPSFALDSLHSLGGGSAHFRMFGNNAAAASTAPSTSTGTTMSYSTSAHLPSPPAPFEGKSCKLAAPPLNTISPPQHASFSTMFDTQVPNPATSSAFSAAAPNSMHSYQPYPHQHQQQDQQHQRQSHFPPPQPPPTTLFDDSESALFSSFLNTLDVDPNFLFNPVLPPGMPSPPTAIPHEDELRERDSLGAQVDGIRLSSNNQAAVQDWQFGARTRDVKPTIDEPATTRQGDPYDNDPQYEREYTEEEEEEEEEHDDHEADPDFDMTIGSGSGNGSRRGRNTRAPVDEPGLSTRTKKIKVEGQGIHEHDGDRDVEMNNANNDELAAVDSSATTTRGTRGARGKRGAAVSTAAARRASSSRPKSTLGVQDEDVAVVDESDEDFQASGATGIDRKPNLSDNQKRSNHIQSEQKRRNAIRNGFKDLVDLLAAGEQASGIVVAPPEQEQYDANGKKKKTKGTGRGRGRKGEVGAGASKSVVLEKATQYILWLERGNEGIEAEIERVENHLKAVGIQVP